MAVVSIKNKLRRGNLLVGNDPYIPTDFESIATVTVGSGGAANVEFTSIPSTYTHLQIRALAKTDRGTYSNDGINITFNSDSGSNYSYHELTADGTNVSAGSGATQSYIFLQGLAATTGSTSTFGVTVIDILDYANTNKYKTVRGLTGFDNNSGSTNQAGYISFGSGNWRNTNAITSITLDQRSSSNFLQYSHFALYGIKAAS